jgi:hypothetical protein
MAENSIYLSLSQAAEETGKSKSVISKALHTGRLSYVEKDEMGYKIDPAELFRVFSKNGANDTKTPFLERKRTDEISEKNAENHWKIILLEQRLEAANEQKSFYKEQCSKMETERDDWKKQAQTLLLTQAIIPPAPKAKNWFSRIFGG